MRYGFVTCVQLGLSCLEELISEGHAPEVLITLHDTQAHNKAGRVFLDDIATTTGTPLVKVKNINDGHAIDAIRDYDLDWLFIIGWSQIAHAKVLNTPRRGVVGMHPTLLPTGRGRASIPWAIIKNLPRTGVTMFKLDSGVDTGPIIAQVELPLAANETATSLYERVKSAHRQLIRRGLPNLLSPDFRPTEQDESLASEWPGRTPDDGRLDKSLSTEEALRLVRATTAPYPGAFVDLDGSRRLRVWAAQRGASTDLPNIELADGLIHATVFDIEAPHS